MPSLNDVQSRLNETDVLEVRSPETPEQISETVSEAAERGLPLCPAGALHSMGGQQFVSGGISLSSAALTGVGPLDREAWTVWVQSGVTWPRLVSWLRDNQHSASPELTIIQKQTGADEMTLGGAVSSNIHGRVLGRRPIVYDIESLHLTDSSGNRLLCSRSENPELFSLAVGGYGLFGFIDAINLRLEVRRQMVRRVREISLESVIADLEAEAGRGATFGDFQYVTDETDSDFMAKGIISTYHPAQRMGPVPEGQLGLSTEDWMRLYVLAHTDKGRAYAEYAAHYLQTDGQLYWSDEHQFSPYLPEAGETLYRRMGWPVFASLMISELYVPRDRFVQFMEAARESLLASAANVVYGTVRLIEAESESYLRWAKADYACIIFNLLVEHSPEGIARGRRQFQGLIDCALDEGGSYYLTYHRWARKDQVEAAYPEFRGFLDLKTRYDPQGVFSSEWHRHHQRMFS